LKKDYAFEPKQMANEIQASEESVSLVNEVLTDSAAQEFIDDVIKLVI